MSYPLYVAFIWHQHQPFYRTPSSARSGMSPEYRLPWVRLHGSKDYLDLALLLSRYPQLQQTINLVPSLILQLQEYAAGLASDPYLALALAPDEKLTLSDRQFILNHFFEANRQTLIDPHPRYAQLYSQYLDWGEARCLERWTTQEYSDLLAWHNLAWIDPLFWDDPEIAAWHDRQTGFTQRDRQQIWNKQRDIIRRILPQHRQMQAAGQLEISTSPYAHPILPLLADTEAARIAIPSIALPRHRFQWLEDIHRHLHKARQIYAENFDGYPRGLWPSEQSVSPEILPAIAEHHFEWLCSDETVLSRSMQRLLGRDETGMLAEPELLYRPYRLETDRGNLAAIFRDRKLSDAIGFTYSSLTPERAAADLIGQLEAIAQALQHRQACDRTRLEQPWLVTIALDGENCWEYYQQDGKPFLEALYERLSQHRQLQTTTVSNFLDRFPPTETLPAIALHSGSWVDGSFSTWIGQPEKNRAWDLLCEARELLSRHPEATESSHPHVWEALYAAEGSDWFWWYGEGHTSNQDATFDRLFRDHLSVIYRALGSAIPEALLEPILGIERRRDRAAGSSISPPIDGRGNPLDWDRAEGIEIGGDRGTMHRSSDVQRLRYGLDRQSFYVRLEFRAGFLAEEGAPTELHLVWYYPGIVYHNSPIPLSGLPDVAPLNYLFRHHIGIHLGTGSLWLEEAEENYQWQLCPSRARVAIANGLELAVPWDDLRVPPDARLHLLLLLSDRGEFRSFFPETQIVELQVP